MKQTTDVLIVGGGIIGCSIAYFLRKHGVEVIVVERGDVGAQASSAAVGLLAPIRPLSQVDPFKSLLLAGMTRIASFVPELEDVSGISVDYEQTGTLRILPFEKIALVPAWAEEWRRSGYRIEVLTSDEARQREPLLYSGLPGAVSIADESQVSPVRMMKAYAQGTRTVGALLYDHTEVVALQTNRAGNRVEGIWTNKHDLLGCNQLVIAAGAWSAQFGEWLGFPLPVRPVRGELIALQQPSPPIRSIIFDEGVFDSDIYLAPKPDGTIIVGATKANTGFDTSVSAGGALHLLDIAVKLLPALAGCSIQRFWAGIRPKTSNSHPLLGPVPQWENVIVASGHGGFGITLSAITGEMIAELIVTGQIPERMSAFVP